MPFLFNEKTSQSSRSIIRRTRGYRHGPITRLMSPSDLGQIVKPFVFLDLFDMNKETINALAGMPLHPHSGIATVTVPTDGRFRYNDPTIGSGTLEYGAVEWMQAGSGVWHGKELSADNVPRIQGFQLWVALPAEIENSEPVSRYIESSDMVQVGPAHLIMGQYDGEKSCVPAPEGMNYLLVTLKSGESWTYQPPTGHTVGWLALAKGSLNSGDSIHAGEMVIFESGEKPIILEASGMEDAVFVLGSAVPHPYDLHLGNYSVHTSKHALSIGEGRIRELGIALKKAGDRTTESGTIPVYR